MNGSERQGARPRRRVLDQPMPPVKWYDYTDWLLERVEPFPKNQRFILGMRLADLTDSLLGGEQNLT